MEFKICRKCEQEKDLSEFRNQKATKDGKKSYCKICDSAYNKENYRKKADNRINQIKNWQQKHPEKVKEYQKKYNDRKHPPRV